MTTEQLLKPRYKVIADYPGNSNIVGAIINIQNAGTPDESAKLVCWWYDKFPHLFQKLEWWEDRKVEEMPEYLNCPSRKMFFKVESWHKSYFIIDGRQKMQYRNYLPATETEYNEYIKTINK